MNDVVPTAANKKEISLSLKLTFDSRDKWVKTAKPSCTDILQMYKHLASYDGEMVSTPVFLIYTLFVKVSCNFPIMELLSFLCVLDIGRIQT